MVYTYFESQKLSHPMSLVPNRTPRALGKTLAGKKMPAGTRLGTAGPLDQVKLGEASLSMVRLLRPIRTVTLVSLDKLIKQRKPG
jgi:hypothetical protein